MHILPKRCIHCGRQTAQKCSYCGESICSQCALSRKGRPYCREQHADLDNFLGRLLRLARS